MKAVILAGGLGERMFPLTEYIPKALVMIRGLPIIHKQLLQLEENSFEEVIILTGHLGHQIEEYLSYFKFKFNLKILHSPADFSPAQRLIKFREDIGDYFILLYCDNYIPDCEEIFTLNESFKYKFVLNKRDKGNIRIKDRYKIEMLLSERNNIYPFVEIGYTLIRDPNFFSILNSTMELNSCFSQIVENETVEYAEHAGYYVSLSNIKVFLKELDKNKIILLDRDGIINKSVGKRKYVTRFEEFNFVFENLEYMQYLSSIGFSFIILTNQPGISTGEVSKLFLKKLHEYIFLKLLEKKINLLAIYVCRHHWDEDCSCRKPKPGLIRMAIDDFELHDEKILFIGDSDKDGEAAKAIGIEGMVVNEYLGDVGNYGLIRNADNKLESVYGIMLN